MEWTIQQKDAIETQNGEILVSAAAGSGKTAVLVERIIKSITDIDKPCDINRFLISTFTKAAADEMREKISSRLLSEISKNPKSKHLKKQLALIYDADINTVHTICSNLIRKNFSAVDTVPNFSLCSDESAALLKMQAMDETLEEFYSQDQNQDFILALETFWTKRDDKNFSNLVLELYENIIALPFYEEWIEKCRQSYDVDITSDLFSTAFGEIIKEQTERMLDAFLKSYRFIEDEILTDGTYKKTFFEELDFIETLIKSTQSFDSLQKTACGFEFSRLAAPKKDTDFALSVKYKNLRTAFKKQINSKKDHILRGDSKYWLDDIKVLKPVIDGLFAVLEKFIQNYKNIKAAKNMLDFNDLEHLALNLLVKRVDGKYVKTDIAKKLSQEYQEIFLDEYQDINQIQELIFFALSKDLNNLFMVGDVKQSIYRFRQADPTIFLKKYNSFSENLSSDKKKILLGQNFRSRGSVIDFINSVFKNVMNEYVGEISYLEKEFLYKNLLYPDEHDTIYNAELAILDCSGAPEDEEQDSGTDNEAGDGMTGSNQEDDLSKLEKEAVFVAQKIHGMMRDGFLIFDVKTGQKRPLMYGDITILLRSTSGRDKVFEDILKSYDIPVLCSVKNEYFQNSDVLFMLSMLKVLDNSRQDIELLSVMRSPVFSFEEDDILSLRLKFEGCCIYDMVVMGAKEGHEKCLRLLDFINTSRKKAQNMPIYELIMYLYEATGYFMMIRGSKGAETRKANLNTLFKLAREYEQTQYKGIFNFINYIDSLIENKSDITIIKNDLDSLNSVKIMSIHKSKGLEFGVCFVCDTAKRFNKTDLNKSMVFHKDIGLGTDFKDINRMIRYPTAAKLAIGEKINLELLSEELRILYVALTRAKEKLIIVGNVKNVEKLLSDIGGYDLGKGALEPYFVSLAKSQLDFIVMGLGLYKLNGIERGRKYSLKTIGNSEFDFCVHDANKIKLGSYEKSSGEPQKNSVDVPDSYIQTAKERLCFVYPFERLKNIPAKLSVTELKGKILDSELEHAEQNIRRTDFKKPKFMEAKGELDFAQRGSAMHMFMQFMDFEKSNTMEEIKEQAEHMVSIGLLTRLQADAVDFNKVRAFFESDIALRMKNSRELYREKRFNLGVDAGRFFDAGEKNHEKMLVQGVIDCFFIENDGGAVLIDFKTDRIQEGNISEFEKLYKLQLEIYKEAIEKIYGVSVKQKIIYSFYLNKGIEV